MTNCKDCQRDFVKLLLMIFLLRKNKNFQILNIFFYFGPPPLIWSLIKISKIPSDSPENFLLCNHCENIMPLLQTIIEIQHFPCLKIVKFCTLSKERCTLARAGCVRARTAGSACGKPFTLVRVLALNPENISLACLYVFWFRRGKMSKGLVTFSR